MWGWSLKYPILEASSLLLPRCPTSCGPMSWLRTVVGGQALASQEQYLLLFKTTYTLYLLSLFSLFRKLEKLP